MFRAGDVVSIMEDRAEVSKLQKGHGEWNEEMTPVRNNLQILVSQGMFIAMLTFSYVCHAAEIEPNIQIL